MIEPGAFPAKTAYMGRMTDPATAPNADPNTAPDAGPVERAMIERLTDALAPTQLRVINESAQHRGHMGDDGSGESHFRVVIESAAFAGQSRVAQQRLVNRALADLLADHIHALAIEARAPRNEEAGNVEADAGR
uniref:BolA family protein n=2 Tax=Sphingomonas citricola TaxID=2862498 RepID=UPI002156572F|nr:BolA family protein [Sphingomonas citricola]